MEVTGLGKTTPVSRFKAVPRSLSRSGPDRPKWSPRRSVVRTPPSCSNKLVLLHKWWLTMVNGKDLAVGGFTQRDQRVSLFRSAAIVKRHDTATIETADAMTIMVSGLIDQLRTNENGFPNEICHRFMLGFPLDWDKYSIYYTRENSARTFTPDEHKLHSGNFPSSVSLISLDSVPTARIRDLMFGLRDGDNELLMKNIADDMLKKLGKTPQRAPANSEAGAKRKIEVEKGAGDETRTRGKSSSRVERSGKNQEEVSGTENEVKEGMRSGRKSKAAAASRGTSMTPGRGVSTRSMTRLRRIENNDEVSDLLQPLPLRF